MKKVLTVTLLAALAGCETNPPVPIRQVGNFQLCEAAVMGSRAYSQQELWGELSSRKENCQQFMAAIQTRAQVDAQRNEALGRLSQQYLKQGFTQPQPIRSFSCQSRMLGNMLSTDCN
jgi:hypothetical protein